MPDGNSGWVGGRKEAVWSVGWGGKLATASTATRVRAASATGRLDGYFVVSIR